MHIGNCMYAHMCVEVNLHSVSRVAMIKALKALQDKIRALELERTAAAEKFRHLGQQAEQHKQQHTVRRQLNKSSQYSAPSEVSTDSEYCACMYVHLIVL